RRQKLSTTSRVWSFELLSTTRTSQSTESGNSETATLSKAVARLWQRLYVHRITEIFMAMITSRLRAGLSVFGSTLPRPAPSNQGPYRPRTGHSIHASVRSAVFRSGRGSDAVVLRLYGSHFAAGA